MLIKCNTCGANNIVDETAFKRLNGGLFCGVCKQQLAVSAHVAAYQPPKLPKPEVQTR